MSAIQQVEVKRVVRQESQQERCCRRSDVVGPLEASAWAEVVSGRRTVAEYNRVCDNLKIFQGTKVGR